MKLEELAVVILALVAASASTHICLQFLQKVSRKELDPDLGPSRPFTSLESAISLLPVIILLAGGFGFLLAANALEPEYVSLPLVMVYVGIVIISMIVIPAVVTRIIGADFKRQYELLAERRSGISVR
ncbi:MAG: hypothetical protein R3F58_12750 [Steroidobacteraceae bacterium]